MDNLGIQISMYQGNSEKKSELIEKYSPFIYNTVHKKVGDKDEELLQIARIAFCEAIDRYSVNKGSFIHFAEIVINNRINDELRRRYRKKDEILLDEDADTAILQKEAVKGYYDSRSLQNCRDEINEYFIELQGWGFRIDRLEEYCPKHKDTRDLCKYAANVLYQNQELKTVILKKKRLPVKQLAKASMLKNRFIEKHSKYITMIFIALNGTYYVIRDYLGGEPNGSK